MQRVRMMGRLLFCGLAFLALLATAQQPPLGNFNGTVRTIGRKMLLIDTADSNAVQFNCSKKTRFYKRSKAIKASDVKRGDVVSVDAKEAIDGSLDAVNVRVTMSRDDQT